MSNEPEVFEYEIADGTLYIRILNADRRVFSQWDGEERITAEEIKPRVQISTDPEWKADTDLGFVKVRGRKYAIEHAVQRLSAKDRHRTRDGVPLRWSSESSYFGGFRNDRGSQVAYDAKAYDSLRKIETEALDQFEKDHPDWGAVSTRQYFEYERNHLTSNAATKRKEAEEHIREAGKWQLRIDQLEL